MSLKIIKKINLNQKANAIITSAKKANNYALNTTENVVLETINIAEQWQKVTDKTLKNSIVLLDNQQKIIFDALDTYKSHFIKSKNRFRKIFA